MKKTLTILALILGTAITALATAWTPKTLPMVHLQDSTKYVCNPDGVLKQPVVDKMDSLLRVLHQKKGVETVVVVVKHIEGDDPYTFCMELGNGYGVGQKKADNGLIVLLATEDRSYQILTGRGLEGTLPDVECYNIEDEFMVPYFKEGNWDEGMLCGIQAICADILQDPSLMPAGPEDEGWGGTLLFYGLTAGGIGALSYYSRKKCPNCKKRKLKVIERVQTSKSKRYYHYKVTYTCKGCGHTFSEDQKINRGGGGAVGAATGGMIFGSRGGSSHSSGGSFGGGSFGGGGSGGRF